MLRFWKQTPRIGQTLKARHVAPDSSYLVPRAVDQNGLFHTTAQTCLPAPKYKQPPRRMSRNEAKIEEKQERRSKYEKMKTTDHRMRVDTVRQQGGRSGGGKAQLLDARMRRARDKKDKFHQAREFVQRSSASQEQRAMAEARILRQRSKQLKSRRTPGLGFTPARFRLMPVENESGTELTALSCNDGGMLRTMSIKQLAEQVSAATFDNMGLAAPVAEAAKQILMMQYRARNAHVKTDPELKPTEIQALAIPEILGQTRVGGKSKPTKSRGARNVFLAAETGSGKTFAYALPLVSMLKQEEAVQKDMDLLRRERRPRALIVVPSRELVKQVTQTLKAIAHHAKVRVIGVHLGVSRRALRTYAEQGPIDIMVSTPGAVLCYMVRDPVFSPASVRRLVIDEADSLMDSHSFGQQTVEVLDLIRRANQTQTGQSEQAIFVSATLPKLIREQIILRYPDVVHVTTPSLHRAPQKLSQTFIDVSKDFQGHRLNALWYVLRTAAADKHAIIFCNNKENANMVFRQMRRRGHPSLLLTGATHTQQQQEGRPPTRGNNHRENEDGGPQQQQPVGGSSINDLRAPVPSFDRDEVLKAFANSDPVPEHLLAPVSVDPEVAQTQSAISTTDGGAPSRVRKILVCTDLASRGLDTTFVTHVVLFDFPTTAIDYLHRSGRTARAGGKGKVSALVGKKDRRLADQIRLAIRQGGVIS